MWFEIDVVQGNDYEVVFNAKDPVTGQPLDLRTGFTFQGHVCKTTDNEETPLYVFPTSADGFVPQNGTLIVRIPGDVSATWSFERVVYGIKVTNNEDGREIMGIRGPLYVQPTVSPFV